MVAGIVSRTDGAVTAAMMFATITHTYNTDMHMWTLQPDLSVKMPKDIINDKCMLPHYKTPFHCLSALLQASSLRPPKQLFLRFNLTFTHSQPARSSTIKHKSPALEREQQALSGHN